MQKPNTVENLVPRGGLRIVRPEEAAAKLAVSASKLAAMVANGDFPKPFKIVPGGRSVGWLEGDVDMWIMSRVSETDEIDGDN